MPPNLQSLSRSTSSLSTASEDRNEETWIDLEPDDEKLTFISLFDSREFATVTEMFRYCKETHDFDIKEIRSRFALDFIDTVKLVNYIRNEVRYGRQPQKPASKDIFADDKYLQPALEDDAVLFSLEDAFTINDESPKSEVEALKEQLAGLQSQFDSYREDVQQVMIAKLEPDQEAHTSNPPSGHAHDQLEDVGQRSKRREKIEEDYFQSYSDNAIHESMLKDTIRTDAYRDFVYDNKHFFKDKVVLDVGCGTGILSMFCAKAGAKLVVSVDNSDIIEKATRIVYDNGLQDKVRCLRGKIEEVTLPVAQVDIIISEWMGYCLLFESMLDSVLFARDRYLKSDGLMVPSHATIMLAPLCDSQLTEAHVAFWKDVYGFDMSAMLDKAFDEGLTRVVDESELACKATPVLQLDLHKTTVADVNFRSAFSLELEPRNTVNLEGFVVWFDIFFMGSRHTRLEHNLSYKQASAQALVAFSTGPGSSPTHWQQGVFLIKRPHGLEEGKHLDGHIAFRKKRNHDRALEIDIEWDDEPKLQSWVLE